MLRRNRRYSSNPTFGRLDRCLANAEWCGKYPNTVVYHLPILYSDNAPILAMSDSNPVTRKRGFKFENWWLQEKDFLDVCKNSWSADSNVSFSYKTNQLGKFILKWVNKEKKPLNHQLKEIEQELWACQQNPNGPQLK